MEKQKTIEKEVSFSGYGIHTGKEVNAKFKPALADSGVNFVRVDLPGKPVVKAHISNIIDPKKRLRRTSIGIKKNGMDVEIHTIEHIMSALCGTGIDNIIVELDSEELPGLDGSAQGFADLVKKAGIKEQNAEKEYFTPRIPIWLEENDRSLVLLPHDSFEVSYTLSYENPLLSSQFMSVNISSEIFEKEIAPARTFCLNEEVEALKKMGLGKGANYKNTIVIGKKGIISNKLRFSNEFVRHKIADLMGDLYLLGKPIKGKIIALKSGHSLNIKLVERMFSYIKKAKEAGIKSPAVFSGMPPFNITDIQNILPHRYPFLLIDRIIELEEDKRAVGIKNVTINEYFFEGHFPGRPIMPGVLIVEAMAQVAGVLLLSKSSNAGKIAYFMSMNNVKFRRTVVPGDQLVFEVEIVKIKSKTGQVRTKASVDGNIVSEADLRFSLVKA
ncbi:MAG: bifunctional UDP-3-O-[3-hydroxymyristoyl] N-acetylglucosamine deacetylase/3-hydroxyacyl-ACP dehydratase [Candidatus Kappaea frigidicola]|nr:bifunctional UDP-3-O-[3-hydroxymyristoyl] N-acetylglucosamine deacetylase/3-hydroxyacyl-ACP dehydratase [Candidatus Kappaea frigidicola]